MDSGFWIDELEGFPRAYVNFALETIGIEGILKLMEGKENRKAQFRTAICLIMEGEEYLFEGIVKGKIIEEKRGNTGFGYDPVFVPEGHELTFAELGNDIKNTISHRARAVEKLCQFLKG